MPPKKINPLNQVIRVSGTQYKIVGLLAKKGGFSGGGDDRMILIPLDNARARSGAEELIPYSDHADFGELLQLVERSKAKRVDVVHGYTEAFARILQGRGIDAHAGQVTVERSEGE